jgi:thioredoxin 1
MRKRAACVDAKTRHNTGRRDMTDTYAEQAPSRAEVDALEGPAVLDFGTDWCGHCRAARPLIQAALARQPAIRHIKVEDGPGRPLGRSYGVKLWPTLIFLKDGEELARRVRPADAQTVLDALAAIAP